MPVLASLNKNFKGLNDPTTLSRRTEEVFDQLQFLFNKLSSETTTALAKKLDASSLAFNGLVTTDTSPSLSDFSLGSFGFHLNSTSTQLHLVINIADTLYKVQLT